MKTLPSLICTFSRVAVDPEVDSHLLRGLMNGIVIHIFNLNAQPHSMGAIYHSELPALLHNSTTGFVSCQKTIPADCPQGGATECG